MGRKRKYNKKKSYKNIKLSKPLVILITIVVILCLLGYFLYDFGVLERFGININNNKNSENNSNNNIVNGDELQVIALEMHGTYGDSFIVKYNNYEILIDAGTPSDKTYVQSALDTYVTDDILDLLIVTHMHNDHFGSLNSDDYFSSLGISVLNIVDNGMKMTSQIYNKYVSLRNYCVESGANYYPIYNIINDSTINTKWYLDSNNSIYLEFFDSGYYLEELSTSSKDQNDFSVCAGLVYGNNKWFFGGDLPTTCEEKLINNIKKIDSNYFSEDNYVVYKTCHHGSKTSNSDELLEFVKPDLVFSMSGIISGNQENTTLTDQHPFIETLDRIKKYTTNVYWTGINGTIIMTSCGSDVSLKFIGRTVDYYYNGSIVSREDEKEKNIYESKWYKSFSN